MVGVGLLVLEVDVVDVAVAVDVGFPLRIQLFEECLLGQRVVVDGEFLRLLDDFLFGGLFVPVDLFGHELAFVEF